MQYLNDALSYGKTKVGKTGVLPFLNVPKQYFLHFYVLGTIWNMILIIFCSPFNVLIHAYVLFFPSHGLISCSFPEILPMEQLHFPVIFDLNEQLKHTQEEQRKTLQARLIVARDKSVSKSKVSKSELGRLAQNLMQEGFYGTKMDAHSPENIKRYSQNFNLSNAAADGIDLSSACETC